MAKLEIQNVVKEYRGGVRANDGISMTVQSGEVFGLLGPNGSGKTTLVNQIIGLMAPTSGQIHLSGVDIVADPGYARQYCSFQPQIQVPIDGLTPLQAIELVGRIRGGETKGVRARAAELIQALDLDQWAEVDGQRLSGGVRRLTAFCMAAVVPGQLVILDEPTNDVDPLRRRLLWQEVRKLSTGGSSVLLVTHNVAEAERAVSRLAIIDRGKVLAAGTPASLKDHEAGHLRLELVLEPESAGPASPGIAIPAFLSHTLSTDNRTMAKVKAADVSEAIAWAQQLKAEAIVEEYSIGPATLEDVYVRIVAQQDAQKASSEASLKEVNHGLPATMVS